MFPPSDPSSYYQASYCSFLKNITVFASLITFISNMPLKRKVSSHVCILLIIRISKKQHGCFLGNTSQIILGHTHYLSPVPQAVPQATSLSSAPHAVPQAAGLSSAPHAVPQAAGLSSAPQAVDGAALFHSSCQSLKEPLLLPPL